MRGKLRIAEGNGVRGGEVEGSRGLVEGIGIGTGDWGIVACIGNAARLTNLKISCCIFTTVATVSASAASSASASAADVACGTRVA